MNFGALAIWKRLFAADPRTVAARALYDDLRKAARNPALYEEGGVPDTIDGRFEMIVLHVFMALHRLKGQGPAARDMEQRLVDTTFDDFDDAIRQFGVADDGVAKRIKVMAEAYTGRIKAYDAAFSDGSDAALEEALRRNVFRLGAPEPAEITALLVQVKRFAADLAAVPPAQLVAGRLK